MTALAGAHQRLAVAVLLLGLVGALAALAALVRRTSSPTLRAYARLTAGLVALQGVLGIVLAFGGRRPGGSLHFVYGPATLLALPMALVLGAGRDERGEAVALFAGLLAVFLLSIRAVMTGQA